MIQGHANSVWLLKSPHAPKTSQIKGPLEEEIRLPSTEFLIIFLFEKGWANLPLWTFLIPQHYHPIQHTLREKKRVHFLQHYLAHTKVSIDFFQRYRSFLFFGSIFYKEHLCLNTKDLSEHTSMHTEVLRLGKDKVCVGNQWTDIKWNKQKKKADCK